MWSPGTTSDDRILTSHDHFKGQEVIVTEKMDGENTSIYRDFVHARSLDSNHHPSRCYVKQLQGTIGKDIPEGYRICGENMYAKHSIPYTNLEDFFLTFSVWREKFCTSWDETLEWCELLNIKHVPVLYEGIWDEELIKGLYIPSLQSETMEGYVVRLRRGFQYENSAKSIAKFVRKSHVKTDSHWMQQMVVPNKVRE